MEDITRLPVFFILGRPRSGTTLLTTLFNAHPNVRIAPEFPIMLPLYQKFRHVKDWDEAAILSFVEHLFRQYVFNFRTLDHYRLNREEFTRQLMELKHKGTVRDFLKSVNYHAFSVYEKKETRWIGDKNPVYSIYVKRFLKIFPEARFICIIRDYRDNFISIRNLRDLRLEAPVLPLQVYRWKYATRLFLSCRKKYPERFRIIRYEDLVTDQERIIRELTDFLEIPFDPSVFEFYRKKKEALDAYNDPLIEKVHGSLMNPVNTSRMNQWKSELTEQQVRMADCVAGRAGVLFGYRDETPRHTVWTWFRSLPMQVYGYILFRLMYYGSFLPYRLSLALSVRLLALVRLYTRLTGGSAENGQEKR